jgi:hypothetical protein
VGPALDVYRLGPAWQCVVLVPPVGEQEQEEQVPPCRIAGARASAFSFSFRSFVIIIIMTLEIFYSKPVLVEYSEGDVLARTST